MVMTRSKTALARAYTIQGSAAAAAAATHTIVCCEPSLYPTFTCPPIKIGDDFYQLIKSHGPLESRKNEDANGYVFGAEIFPLEEYEFIGQHHNDRASTAFIDTTAWEGQPTESADEELDDMLADTDFRYTPEYSALAQRLVPGQIWTGETVGGAVGAALYIHRNRKNIIDGLLVDSGNGYYFPDPEKTD